MDEIGMISKVSFGSLFLYLLGVQAQFDCKAVYETPDVYPSPNTTGAGGWAKAFEKAQEFVDKLTLDEKAGLVTGTLGPCDGNIAPIPRLNFGGLCIQGLRERLPRWPDCRRDLEFALHRGIQLGSEFKAKGARVALGGFSTGGILWSIYPIPDVCFVFLKYFVSEGPDHRGFHLNNNGSAGIRKVAGSCPNTIVVTHSGSLNVMPWVDHENATAILLAHLPGEQSGNAALDVITGKYNPSSKLPFTIAYNESDYNTKITNFTAMSIIDTNGQQIDFTEGLSIDYRNFDSQGIEPRYEFGFGLSYTIFSITSMQVHKRSRRISAHPLAQVGTTAGGNPALWDELGDVNFTIQNTGSLTGTAIPQFYLSYPVGTSESDTPVQILRGFDSIKIPASGSQTVRLSLRRRDLSRWDVAAQDWKIPTGEFTLKLGMSSRDIHQMKTVEVL